ncbi:hypothetical protein HAX54_017885, partial [Datura stramonium]|nr:hypothetical protein [Datura stramonium]
GMTTIGYSSVGSGKMPMEHRFRLILALGHYLDPALHRQFVDWNWRLTSLSP